MRSKSLRLTDYLMDLQEATGLTKPPYDYAIGTPREAARRGGHVAVEHAAGPQIVKALKVRGVVPDFRSPNVIRLAPIALYTSFAEVWQVVGRLRSIIDGKEHEAFAATRDLVA